jgi:hypothetical protein
MSPRAEYAFWKYELHCRVAFYDDRLEYTWDTFGLGVEHGKRTFGRHELSPNVAEAVGLYNRSIKGKLFFWACLLIALAIHWSAPKPYIYIEYLFFAALVGNVGRTFYYIIRRSWILIYSNDGSQAVSVLVSGWTKAEREEFKSFYVKWIESRNGERTLQP